MTPTGITIGQKFGSLTVLEILPLRGPVGHRQSQFKVQCTCGKEFALSIAWLKKGAQKCVTCSRSVCGIGDVFDQLTVIGFAREDEKRGRLLAICQCSCGAIVRQRPYLFFENKTNSCGCKPNGRWAGFGELSRTFLYRVKRNARTRNIPFNVSGEYLWSLFEDQQRACALSGVPIAFHRYTTGKSTASLDRIDSKRPYEEGNLHWVHKDVNRMKRDLSYDRFIELCTAIEHHIQKQEKPILDTLA